MTVRRAKRILAREIRADFHCWVYGTGRRDPILVRENRIQRCMKIIYSLRAKGYDVGRATWE